MAAPRRILVTSALPYANGPIHLGHLVEYIQTDIWVRFQRLCGHQAHYFCADDTHGTPVMIAAQRAGISPEALVEEVHKEHLRDLNSFGVEFDLYYTTNSPENRELAEHIYKAAKTQGAIARRSVEQLYCPHDKMFLPDRFVRGRCPNCSSDDQYGDSCEVCGATYTPRDLKEPHCALCGTVPETRSSDHLFFVLSKFQDFLNEWIATPGRVDEGVRKKLNEWLQGELRDWDISRDGPYFGFAIPEEKDKYFYVWLDAPIGYMAASKRYFTDQRKPDDFDFFWKSEKGEVYHFIGKDIVYFHTLFWPALLRVGGFRTPTAVYVHGFLTINGEKMSKSRGTLIRAETFRKHIEAEALRYFYAARLNGGLDDLDMSQTDFLQRWNAEVVGSIANLFSRLIGGIAPKLEFRLAKNPSAEGAALASAVRGMAPSIQSAFADRDFARAIREINQAAAEINRFVNERAPWNLIKSDVDAARAAVTDALNASVALLIYLKPVTPALVARAELILGLSGLDYSKLNDDLPAGHTLKPYEHIAKRIEEGQFSAMLADEVAAAAGAVDHSQKKAKKEAPVKEESSGIIAIEDLGRVELRVGRIIEANTIEGADRLLSIALDIGEAKPRQVIAGIRVAYQPEQLKGMSVVCVANLAPRKMKFGVSEAMLLAAGEGESLTLFVPHRDAKPGDRLR